MCRKKRPHSISIDIIASIVLFSRVESGKGAPFVHGANSNMKLCVMVSMCALGRFYVAEIFPSGSHHLWWWFQRRSIASRLPSSCCQQLSTKYIRCPKGMPGNTPFGICRPWSCVHIRAFMWVTNFAERTHGTVSITERKYTFSKCSHPFDIAVHHVWRSSTGNALAGRTRTCSTPMVAGTRM